MKKLAIAIIAIICILIAFPIINKCGKEKVIVNDSIQTQIDSLSNKKDSLSNVINDINDSLKEIHEEFIINRDSILNQPVWVDYEYFTNYLNNYFGHSNNNNSDSVKRN